MPAQEQQKRNIRTIYSNRVTTVTITATATATDIYYMSSCGGCGGD